MDHRMWKQRPPMSPRPTPVIPLVLKPGLVVTTADMIPLAVDSQKVALPERKLIFDTLYEAGASFGFSEYIVDELTEAVMDALKKHRESMAE